MHSYVITPENLFMVDGSMSAPEYRLIHDMPSDLRPREKLLTHGPEALTTRELAILLLITGTTKEAVTEMANRLVKDYGEKNIFAERDANKLSEDLDIPLVKACQIVAAGELGRRYFDTSKTNSVVIRNAKDVYDYLLDMRNLPKEQLRGLYLNSRGRIIKDEIIAIGTVNSSLIHPREVFNPAIGAMAAAVILAHNHPSGDIAPSDEDVRITEQLVQAGKILGIRVLDHVIITKDGFASVQATY